MGVGVGVSVTKGMESQCCKNKSALESANSELQLADSNADSSTDSSTIGVWVWV